jgi:hypothetical protein
MGITTIPIYFATIPIYFATIPIYFATIPIGIATIPICFAVIPIGIATIPIHFAVIPMGYSDAKTAFSPFPADEWGFYRCGGKRATVYGATVYRFYPTDGCPFRPADRRPWTVDLSRDDSASLFGLWG